MATVGILRNEGTGIMSRCLPVRLFVILGIVGVAAVALAACGGDDEAAAPTEVVTEESAPGAAEPQPAAAEEMEADHADDEAAGSVSASSGTGHDEHADVETAVAIGEEQAAAELAEGLRWDIVSVDFSTRPRIWTAGGEASALADDGSKITLTGSGTFGGSPTRVTGGGDWTIFDPDGDVSGSGTYEVEALVNFFPAPGALPADDRIGAVADSRAGLAVFRIRYSDEKGGTLVVSSHVRGTPHSVSHGITATKGFVPYWQRQAPMPNVDANRMIFHVVR